MSEKPLFVIAFSDRGEALASGLAAELDAVLLPGGSAAESIRERWGEAQAFIAVGAAAILIRLAAPLLKDKSDDPALIVIPEDGAFVLPLVGSHLAGGLDLAQRCAAILAAPCLSTTATDRKGLVAPDLLARRLGWALVGREELPRLNGRLADGGALSCFIDPALESDIPLPWGYNRLFDIDEADMVISWHRLPLLPGQCQLVPPLLTAGLGCRPGASRETLLTALERGLELLDLRQEGLRRISTLRERAEDSDFDGAASALNLPLHPLSREEVSSVEGNFSPSAATRHLNLPGVAEPCAARFGRLLAPRFSGYGVTVAFAAEKPAFRGRLAIVGTGPGDSRFLTGEAERVLGEAGALVGYGPYLERLPRRLKEGKIIHGFTMGEEERRVRLALDLARKGYDVALVSGGDPVLFGMAGLALNLAGEIPVRLVPGLSAFQAASTLLGAPYTNGLSCISLSDYLQPWPDVVRALEGAASGGLAVALYNPVRRGLEEKLAEVRRIFAERGFVFLVRNAGRGDESARCLPLGGLRCEDVDMTTLLFLPPLGAFHEGGRLIDSRGYRSERGEKP